MRPEESEGPEPGAAKDLDAIQGTWSMVSLEVNGEAMPEDQVRAGRLVVKGDRYKPIQSDRAAAFTIVLDPSQTPRWINFTADDGPGKGQVLRGIYKLERDTFTVCRAVTAEDERPTEFSTGAESGLWLVVWRRSKGPG